jgi:hypothetical protein
MRSALILFCVMYGVACQRGSRDVSVSQLLGTYEMRTTGQLELIVIKADGTYEHSIARYGKKTTTQTGEWIVRRDGDFLWLSMSRFDTSGWPDDTPGAGQLLEYGAPVTVERNRIVLDVFSDLGYRYVKR